MLETVVALAESAFLSIQVSIERVAHIPCIMVDAARRSAYFRLRLAKSLSAHYQAQARFLPNKVGGLRAIKCTAVLGSAMRLESSRCSGGRRGMARVTKRNLRFAHVRITIIHVAFAYARSGKDVCLSSLV